MTYTSLLPYLIQDGRVVTRKLKPVPGPPKPWFNENAKCAFHANSPGHTTEDCFAFKCKVQELIDRKLLTFADVPNIANNPLPRHGTSSVNALIEEGGLVMEVGQLKMSLKKVFEELKIAGLLEEGHDDCLVFQGNPEHCVKFKNYLQRLMYQHLVQFSRTPAEMEVDVVVPLINNRILRVSPVPEEEPVTAVAQMTVDPPGRLPYENTRAVPWSYEHEVVVGGKPMVLEETTVENITSPSGMTRSGRVYHQDPMKNRGAEKVSDIPLKKVGATDLSTEELKDIFKQSDETLKIIKRSDYKVVDQLSQTPAKISILSLLRNSESHKVALLKFLDNSYVAEDITINQLDVAISSLNDGSCLSFTDADLPQNEGSHNMALHISVTCGGTTLARVFVDTGSALNVIPKTTLAQLQVEEAVIKPSSLIVKAFDGSRRMEVGQIDLPVLIGPQLFNITFQVMDIFPAYRCLLGRPWIHGAKAVTSTLHQKLKFLLNNQVVEVSGEEDYLVSHLSEFKYVDVGDEVHETLFQALEIVGNVQKEIKTAEKPNGNMTRWQDVKALIEAGNPEGWGTVINIAEKKDKSGLGYQPSSRISGSAEMGKGRIPRLEDTVVAKGFRSEKAINAIEDDERAVEFSQMVFRTPPGVALKNWSVKDVTPLISLSK